MLCPRIPRLAVLGLVSLPSFALATSPQDLRIETYSVEQGLSQSSPWSMLQDQQGFLWIGTADGLNRYDGYSFVTFRHDPRDSTSIPNNTVWSICQDRTGIFWLGTLGGLVRFDPSTRIFTRVADIPRHKGTALEGVVRGIVEDRTGRLWLDTPTGIIAFNPSTDSLRQYSREDLPSENRSPTYKVLGLDDDGNVWTANGQHLFLYNQAVNRFIRVPVGASDEKLSMLAVARDQAGHYWFASHFSGVWCFDPRTGQWKAFRHNPNDPSTLPDDRLRSIGVDNDGGIWAGTIFRGLCYLDRSTETFHPIKPSGEGKKNSRYEGVTTMVRDRSGLMWVGYDGAGIIKVNPYRNKFRHVLLPPSGTPASGDNFFKAIMVDKNDNVWLGMYDQGLSVLSRKTGEVRRYRHDPGARNGIASNTVLSLLESRSGKILIGTYAGLNELDPATGVFVHHTLMEFTGAGMRGQVVTAICEDSLGTLWCGTGTSLVRYDRTQRRFEEVLSTPEFFDLPISPSITSIIPAAKGGLWVGTLGGGLLKIRKDGTVERRYTHARNSDNSLSHDAVKTILIDSDNILWIGTEDGLNRFDPSAETWRSYRVTDGLPNSFIYGILMDDHRRLWISTNKGIARMNTIDPDNPAFRNYTPDDGLQSYEFNTNVYFKSPQGEMFFGGVNGFNSFFPDSVSENGFVPAPVLTGFKKFDVPFVPGTDPSRFQSVTLEPGESVFSFEFATLEFTNPSRNQFAYMMEGFDDDWIPAGTRREARYTNLDPGEYTFRVKGTNSDGIWNETGTSVSVTIVPPFWKTGWFIGALSLVLIGSFGIVVRFVSTRKLRRQIEQMEREKVMQEERQKTREGIARDLHDDLASTVGSAGFFVESVKRQLGEAPPQAREFLDKTSSLLTEAEQSMSDIVWSVSPQHDSVDSLFVRMRVMTADICRAAGKRYEIDTSCDNPEVLLSGTVRRGFYLVFKEALINATRHSGAGVITVGEIMKDDVLEISVTDDGEGMPDSLRSNRPGGHGLRNMRQRAAEIGAELSVTSSAGEGTSVRLTKRMTPKGH